MQGRGTKLPVKSARLAGRDFFREFRRLVGFQRLLKTDEIESVSVVVDAGRAMAVAKNGRQ